MAAVELEFIVSSSSPRPGPADRKRIRSHVLRARTAARGSNKKRRDGPAATTTAVVGDATAATTPYKSWVNPHEDLPDVGLLPSMDLTRASAWKPPARPLCPDLALFDFGEPMRPYMLRAVHSFLTYQRHALDPAEACSQVAAPDRDHLAYLTSDSLCLHMIIFLTQSFTDAVVAAAATAGSRGHERQHHHQLGIRATAHLSRTLELLRCRLADPDPAHAVSDSTILVVALLAGAARDMGDEGAALRHADGLSRIVDARGGLGALSHKHHRIQRKICRADLGIALRFGTRPRFFRDTTSWAPYLAADEQDAAPSPGNNSDAGHTSPSSSSLPLSSPSASPPPTAPAQAASAFVAARLGPRLQAVWRDARRLSRLVNLAAQTGRAVRPSLAHEAMVSALYRLLHLEEASDEGDSNDEGINGAVRLGLLAYTVSVYLGSSSGSERDAAATIHDPSRAAVAERLRCGLFGGGGGGGEEQEQRRRRRAVALSEEAPPLLRLWVYLALAAASAPASPPGGDEALLDEAVRAEVAALGIGSWRAARDMLLSGLMWTDAVHGPAGREVVERALRRAREARGGRLGA